jgi:hypothetical protein
MTEGLSTQCLETQPLAILLPAASARASLVVVAAAHEVAALFANKFATVFCDALAAHWTVKHRFVHPIRGLGKAVHPDCIRCLL